MRLIYINLDTSQKRRTIFEDMFSHVAPPGWSVERFAAIHGTYADRLGISGKISSAEKGCFLSHKSVIENNASLTTPIHICEDDTFFSMRSFKVLDAILNANSTQMPDLLFTDVGIADIPTMAKFVGMKRKSGNKFTILNLRTFEFFGTNSYIVTRSGASKLAKLLESVKEINTPYDLWLRSAIKQGVLTAGVIFPFVSTVSMEADYSQIHNIKYKRLQLIWNTYRRLIWMDGSPSSIKTDLKKLDAELSEETRALGIIWSALLDPFIPSN